MKIAIPTDDRMHISQHFGRTSGFMIIEIVENKISQKEHRENTFTGHAKGHNRNEERNHQRHHHNHNGIFTALHDVNAVIAGGMGRRLLTEFEAKNINVFITREQIIEKAIALFLENKLDHNASSCCDH